MEEKRTKEIAKLGANLRSEEIAKKSSCPPKKKKKKEESENKQKTKNVETRERERNERQPRDAHFTYLRDFLQALPNRAQKNRGKLVPRSERKKKK